MDFCVWMLFIQHLLHLFSHPSRLVWSGLLSPPPSLPLSGLSVSQFLWRELPLARWVVVVAYRAWRLQSLFLY